METKMLAAVVRFGEKRKVEAVFAGDVVKALIPGDIRSTITLAARGRELTFEVPEHVIDFLTAE